MIHGQESPVLEQFFCRVSACKITLLHINAFSHIVTYCTNNQDYKQLCVEEVMRKSYELIWK